MPPPLGAVLQPAKEKPTLARFPTLFAGIEYEPPVVNVPFAGVAPPVAPLPL